jgi:hypothetical protein
MGLRNSFFSYAQRLWMSAEAHKFHQILRLKEDFTPVALVAPLVAQLWQELWLRFLLEFPIEDTTLPELMDADWDFDVAWSTKVDKHRIVSFLVRH